MTSIFLRGRRWLGRPRAERNRILRRKLQLLAAFPLVVGRATFANLFLGYQPDSHADFGEHPEFKRLFKAFTAHNRLNNAGDIARLWSLILNIKQVLKEGLQGDFAEVGVWRGNSASVLAYFAKSHGRSAILFDTFQGFDRRDLADGDASKQLAYADTSLDMVKRVVGGDCQACEFVVGFFPDSINDSHRRRQYSVVSLDCDLYKPTKAGLEFFYPRMSEGGLLVLHDYSSGAWQGARQAVDEFCDANGEYVVLLPDKSGSAIVRKSRRAGEWLARASALPE